MTSRLGAGKSLTLFNSDMYTHLDTLDDEANKVGEDGEQIHHVEGRLEELPLLRGARESHHIFCSRQHDILRREF